MKKLISSLILLSIFSCGEANKTTDNQNTASELQAYKTLEAEEENAKQFIENYIKIMNASDWKSKAAKYLPPNSDDFMAQHAAFRESFPNYRTTIKHLTADGNKVIVWLSITANYAATYTFEDKYIQEAITGIEAKNQAISWNETWYFDVVDGKFGEEWDFLKDNYAILKTLKAIPK